MALPPFHLSRPGVCFPEVRVDNAGILERVKREYRGTERKWAGLETAIERVFTLCNSQARYYDEGRSRSVAAWAAAAAENCLEVNGADRDEIDLLIFGGITREYFEPATAMEVAARLGLERVHALDVTSACVGHLEGIQAAAAYLTMHSEYRTAMICAAESVSGYLSYDIQRTKDLKQMSAGLTIGDGAACMLLRREPWPRGGLRVLEALSEASPKAWELCRAPIRGTFTSSTVDLMRLAADRAPGILASFLRSVGWGPRDLDHIVLHQPSEHMVRAILEEAGMDAERAIYTHHLYGNNGSATVGIVLDRLLRDRAVTPGDKILLGGAASGFVVSCIAGEWTANGAGNGTS